MQSGHLTLPMGAPTRARGASPLHLGGLQTCVEAREILERLLVFTEAKLGLGSRG